MRAANRNSGLCLVKMQMEEKSGRTETICVCVCVCERGCFSHYKVAEPEKQVTQRQEMAYCETTTQTFTAWNETCWVKLPLSVDRSQWLTEIIRTEILQKTNITGSSGTKLYSILNQEWTLIIKQWGKLCKGGVYWLYLSTFHPHTLA